MLATLCLLLLLSLPFTYAATEILDVSNSSLVFSPGWSQELFVSTGDSVLQTDSFGGSLTASLPNSTSSVSYVGFNTAGESMYGYTIDCEDDCVLRTVNGSDPSLNDGEIASNPSTLFTIDLDPSSQHVLRVFNIPSDADDGSSQITFDHLNISVQDNAASSPTSATDILGPISFTVASASSTSSTSISRSTAKVPASSAKATPSGGSATPSSVPTGSATRLSPSSSASADDQPSAATPVLPVTTSAASSSASSGGVSKSVIVAATVLSLVFTGALVAALVVFLRERRKKRNSYASSQAGSGSLSPTGSIIPIMPPPQMRTASLNPFSDPPFAEVPLDSPGSSSLMQRRMDSRSTSPASPGAPPNIPLPDLPLDRRPKMESRNDLWIARTPVKSHFSAV
ncbi:hypothetical protein C8F04DRAFT_1251941 [Mycena alexandri]|uniref:Uncharacterized protein n=1 Tax=Mycena alexandri TaxID=1745969 RepID=A0AAD6TBW2_9AGAR|nr:hypothetical protein C8F04DRAFT_1251941 [Mycena alexandri]